MPIVLSYIAADEDGPCDWLHLNDAGEVNNDDGQAIPLAMSIRHVFVFQLIRLESCVV